MSTSNVPPVLTVVNGSVPAAKRRSRVHARRKARMSAKQRRTAGQFVAAAGACFLPVASWQLAHAEVQQQPMLWGLVGAALLFSLPSVSAWAKTWTGNGYKAVGFAVLLEGCMTFAHTPWLTYGGLGILAVINAYAAFGKARGK